MYSCILNSGFYKTLHDSLPGVFSCTEVSHIQLVCKLNHWLNQVQQTVLLIAHFSTLQTKSLLAVASKMALMGGFHCLVPWSFTRVLMVEVSGRPGGWQDVFTHRSSNGHCSPQAIEPWPPSFRAATLPLGRWAGFIEIKHTIKAKTTSGPSQTDVELTVHVRNEDLLYPDQRVYMALFSFTWTTTKG